MENDPAGSTTSAPRLSQVALASFGGTLAALTLVTGARFAWAHYNTPPSAQDRLQAAADQCQQGEALKQIRDGSGGLRSVTITSEVGTDSSSGRSSATSAAQCMAAELRLPGSLAYPMQRMLSTEGPLLTQYQGVHIYLGKTGLPQYTVAVFSVDQL